MKPVIPRVQRCAKSARVKASIRAVVELLRSGLPKGLESCIRRAYLAGRFPRFRRASHTFIHNKRLQ